MNAAKKELKMCNKDLKLDLRTFPHMESNLKIYLGDIYLLQELDSMRL